MHSHGDMLSHILINPTTKEYKLFNSISKHQVSNSKTRLYSFSEDLNSVKVEGGYNLDNLVKLIIEKDKSNNKNETLYVNDRLRTEGGLLYLTALQEEGWYSLSIIYSIAPEGVEMSLMGSLYKLGEEIKLLDNEEDIGEVELIFNYLDGVMDELEPKLGKIYNKLSTGILKESRKEG